MGGKTGAKSNSRVLLEGRGTETSASSGESHMTDFCRFRQLSRALRVQGPPPQAPELCCSEKAKLSLSLFK